MSKNILLAATAIALLAVVGCVLYGQSAATPTSFNAMVTPELATVNQPVTAKVTVALLPGTDLPLNINLLRIEANGSGTIIGALNDTGTNGDARAADRIYTAQLVINEAHPKTLQFQATAALRGQIRRTLSNVVQFAVLLPTTPTLRIPPDPGEEGKATVAGIDTDRDGIRDDVQRFIVFSEPGSTSMRAAMSQFAASLQTTILQPANNLDGIRTVIRAQRCLHSRLAPGSVAERLATLQAVVLNTQARLDAWIQANAAFSGHTLESDTAASDSCNM